MHDMKMHKYAAPCKHRVVPQPRIYGKGHKDESHQQIFFLLLLMVQMRRHCPHLYRRDKTSYAGYNLIWLIVCHTKSFSCQLSIYPYFTSVHRHFRTWDFQSFANWQQQAWNKMQLSAIPFNSCKLFLNPYLHQSISCRLNQTKISSVKKIIITQEIFLLQSCCSFYALWKGI